MAIASATSAIAYNRRESEAVMTDEMRDKLAKFPPEVAVALTELLCMIENIRDENDQLKAELLELKLRSRTP